MLRGVGFAVLPLLLFHLNNYAQIDPEKVDSLSRLIDSSAHAYKAQQDSFIKYQDSAHKSEVDKVLQQNSGNPENFLTEQKRREEKDRQKTLVRIMFGVLLFLIAIIALMRRRKTKP